MRSAGPDGMTDTKDDIVALRGSVNLKGVGAGVRQNIEETAGKGGRGLARGLVQGAREGLAKKDKPKEQP